MIAYLGLLMPGCATLPVAQPEDSPSAALSAERSSPRATLDSETVRTLHNNRVRRLRTAWARCHFQTSFLAANQEMQVETGDAVLMTDNGLGRFLLIISQRSGDPVVTIGYNEADFWTIFHGDTLATVGPATSINAYSSNGEDEWAIRPAAAAVLTGLRQIPPSAPIRVHDDPILGQFFIYSIPDSSGDILFKMWLPANGSECCQVDLYSADESSLLATSRLSQYFTPDESDFDALRFPRQILFDFASGRVTALLSIQDVRSETPRGPVPPDAFHVDRHLAGIPSDRVIRLN